jgi:hypothetical protein
MARPKNPDKARARKPRGPNKAKGEKAPAQSSQGSEATVGKQPAPEDVRDLVETLTAYDDKKQTLSEGARETLADAIEVKHIDRTALGWARTLYKKAQKDPESFAISFSHFLSYVEDLGLPRIADNSRGLALGDDPPHITGADVVHSEAA